jgi:hypothetical protein
LGFGSGGVDRQIDFGGGIDPNEVMYRADVDPTADLDAAYTSALGRTIGDEGKTFWRSEIDKAVASGVPYQTALNNAIAAIKGSGEATNFKTTGVARSDVPGSTVIQPAFTPVQPADIQGDLDAIYRSVLGPNRGIQQEGLDHFTADYNRYRQQGATHEQALANIRASVEQSSEADVYQGKVAQLTNSLNSLYTDLLGRGIGKTGLNYWTDEYNKLVGQGMNATDAMNAIRNSIMQSEEYQIYQQTQQPYVVPEDERIELPCVCSYASAAQLYLHQLKVANQQAAQIDQAVRATSTRCSQLSAEELVQHLLMHKPRQFAEEVQAAQAQPTPEATVQGQLTNLMAEFEDGQTPAWAAGAMRNATAIMAQRGLGASSMAGQAIIQAAMESALPIAMQDAQTMAQFEMQNLSNRQQRAMLSRTATCSVYWTRV